MEGSGEPSAAVDRFAQDLAEAREASDTLAGAGLFAEALVGQKQCVGFDIIRRVIDDTDSSLVEVAGATLSAIRSKNADRALQLAKDMVSIGLGSGVAYAYGPRLASAPEISIGELEVICKLAADDNEALAHFLSVRLRFMAERDPSMALTVILKMRIGRSMRLASDVLWLLSDESPIRIELGKRELGGILKELVVCNGIHDYGIQAFLATLSRRDPRAVVRLLQRRVERSESHDGLDNYDPIPFDWPDEWRLESRGTRNRRQILEELRDWATKDDPGWRRRYEAPRLFAAVAREFDDEVLGVIEQGLKDQVAIASNVANLLSEVPHGLAWSHVRWIVRILEDSERRDAEPGDAVLYKAVGYALHSAFTSGVRMGTLGEPFPEDVVLRDRACEVADGLPPGSPGERFYRSLHRFAKSEIKAADSLVRW